MTDARAAEGEQGWRFYSGLHRLLLRVAGHVPDDWLTGTRAMLAGGDLPQVPDTVMGSLVEWGVPMTAGEVALLQEIVRVVFGDRDPAGLHLVTVREDTTPTGHRFFPVRPDVLETNAARIPPRLDLTGCLADKPWQLPPSLSHLDDLAMLLTDGADLMPLALRDNQDVRSIARAWRFPPDGPLTDGVRVVLIEVTPSTPAWDIAAHEQRELALVDEQGPQVEVLWSGDDVTPYHRAALDRAALLYRAGP